jgi:spore coat protein H
MLRIRLAFVIAGSMAAGTLGLLAQTPATAPVTLTAAQLFDTNKIWDVHVTFSPEAQSALMPPPAPTLAEMGGARGVPGFVSPEGRRNGISGFRGIDFQYVHASLDFAGRTFPDVAVRLKGNGTFTPVAKFGKPSYKIDLNKYVKGQKLAGVSTINLHNNTVDTSWMNEVLAYRLYRDAGTPAPRTAYARVYVTVTGKQTREYAGLYSLAENVDEDFVEDRYKVNAGALFKPVTTALFHDLGKDWKAYNQIYDPKTEPTAADTARVTEFSSLVTSASDQTFAARFAEFVDVDAFAKHMAVVVWLGNPDSLLSQGQNFYLYLHPTTKKFVFIPWDQDHSFGQFAPWRSAESQQQLDILRPWSPGSFATPGQNRFIERVFALEAFKKPYLANLASLARTVAAPARLLSQIDELARVLQPVVAAEPMPARAESFKLAIGEATYPRFINTNVPLVPIKVFVRNRDASVRRQLQAAGVP